MKEHSDIRWQQRFRHYIKALSQLKKFVEKGDALNELEEQGMIKAFEYTYELAWNTIKDFYEEQGGETIQGSRDAIQLAFRRGVIKNGQGWMKMLLNRNQTSPTYNEDVADQIAKNIINYHYELFCTLELEFNGIIERENTK